jgi:hypothetical protein
MGLLQINLRPLMNFAAGYSQMPLRNRLNWIANENIRIIFLFAQWSFNGIIIALIEKSGSHG